MPDGMNGQEASQKSGYIFCGTYDFRKQGAVAPERVAHFATPGMSEADISALKEYCKHKNRPASMNDSFNNVRLRAGGVVWDKDQIEERLEHMHHPEDKAQLNRALEVIGKWNEKPKDFAQKAVHS